MSHYVPTPEEVATLPTQADFTKLSKKEKLALLMEAKSGTWYTGWKPYCMTCSTIQRMEERDYGFECKHCKNQIGFTMKRLKESPLNNPEYVIPPKAAFADLATLMMSKHYD